MLVRVFFKLAVFPRQVTFQSKHLILVDENDSKIDEVVSLQLNLILIEYCMCVLVTVLFIQIGGLDLWWYT